MRRILLGIAVMSAALLSGCAAVGNPSQTDYTIQALAEAENNAETSQHDDEYETESCYYEPLKIERNVVTYKENYIFYPEIIDESASSINNMVLDAVIAEISKATDAVYTYYLVKCNSDGIYSVLIYICDLKTDETVSVIPINYDITSMKTIRVSDCFSKNSDRWRNVIPDILTVQAEEKGIVLLSDLMPIDDERLFYICEDKIVMLFRRYEITTYEAGMPEFSIPLCQLAEFIDESCPTYRLLGGAK